MLEGATYYLTFHDLQITKETILYEMREENKHEIIKEYFKLNPKNLNIIV